MVCKRANETEVQKKRDKRGHKALSCPYKSQRTECIKTNGRKKTSNGKDTNWFSANENHGQNVD
jgi:hypothetical protein